MAQVYKEFEITTTAKGLTQPRVLMSSNELTTEQLVEEMAKALELLRVGERVARVEEEQVNQN